MNEFVIITKGLKGTPNGTIVKSFKTLQDARTYLSKYNNYGLVIKKLLKWRNV